MNSEIAQVKIPAELSAAVLNVINSEITNRDIRRNDCVFPWNIVVEFENEELGESFCNWLSTNYSELDFDRRSWWDGSWYVNFGRRIGSDGFPERAVSQVFGKVSSNGMLLPRKSLEELWDDFLRFMDFQIEKSQIPTDTYGFHPWVAIVKFDRGFQATNFFDWLGTHRHKLFAHVYTKEHSYGEVIFGCEGDIKILPKKEEIPVIGRFCLNGEFSQE